jgi:NADH dehydrogenase
MAIIGRRSAVVDAFGIHLAGSPAWIGWLGLHLLYLSGLRNRLVVLMDCIAAYASPTRGAGVITRPVVRAGRREAGTRGRLSV